MDREKILEKFSKENLLDMLMGARIKTKKDEEIIDWLLNERRRLEREIIDRWGYGALEQR
jgi:hypothetical protein